MPVLGHGPPNMDRYNNGVKDCKALAKILDTHLNGKSWLVGDRMTIADIYVGSSLILAFQTVFDFGFRKAHPHLTKWFEAFIGSKAILKRFGRI